MHSSIFQKWFSYAFALVSLIYGYSKKPKKSFSQKGEDLILATYFGSKKLDGVYLDIGCFHPRWISNTHIFHKRGWSGYAVDVDQHKLEAMKLARGQKVSCMLGGVVGKCEIDAEGTIYKFDRLWSDIDTLDNCSALEASKRGAGDFREEKISLLDINRLLNELPHINLLNIDIEGLDSELIKNMNFEKFLPDAILFEDNQNWGGTETIVTILKNHGYKHLFTSAGSVCFAQPNRK